MKILSQVKLFILLNYRGLQKDKVQRIEDRQQELRKYQRWHLGVQNELDNLKQQKKDTKYQLKLAKAICCVI